MSEEVYRFEGNDILNEIGDNFTGSDALRNLTMTFTYIKSN